MIELSKLVWDTATAVVKSWDLKWAREHGAGIDAAQIWSRLNDVTGHSRDEVIDAVHDFFWVLLRDGLAVPHRKGSYSDLDTRMAFQTVYLTPFGVEALTATQPTAHDQLRMLEAFDELVGAQTYEDIRETYAAALLNFRLPITYVGCAILLGVASEDLIDRLISETRLTEPTRKLLEKKAGHQKATASDRAAAIQEIWEQGIARRLQQAAKDHPDRLVLEELQDVVLQHLKSFALLVRSGRNKGGHPNRLGKLIQAELFGRLNLFPLYCHEIRKLILWMQADPDRVF